MILTSRKQLMKETMTTAHKDHRMKEMNIASKDLRLNMIRAHGKQRTNKQKMVTIAPVRTTEQRRL